MCLFFSLHHCSAIKDKSISVRSCEQCSRLSLLLVPCPSHRAAVWAAALLRGCAAVFSHPSHSCLCGFVLFVGFVGEQPASGNTPGIFLSLHSSLFVPLFGLLITQLQSPLVRCPNRSPVYLALFCCDVSIMCKRRVNEWALFPWVPFVGIQKCSIFCPQVCSRWGWWDVSCADSGLQGNLCFGTAFAMRVMLLWVVIANGFQGNGKLLLFS